MADDVRLPPLRASHAVLYVTDVDGVAAHYAEILGRRFVREGAVRCSGAWYVAPVRLHPFRREGWVAYLRCAPDAQLLPGSVECDGIAWLDTSELGTFAVQRGGGGDASLVLLTPAPRAATDALGVSVDLLGPDAVVESMRAGPVWLPALRTRTLVATARRVVARGGRVTGVIARWGVTAIVADRFGHAFAVGPEAPFEPEPALDDAHTLREAARSLERAEADATRLDAHRRARDERMRAELEALRRDEP